MTALIGIDIGTTNIKAVAFSPDGQALAQGITPNQADQPRPGWAEYRPDQLWEKICRVTRQMMASLPSDVTPRAVTIASMAEAGLPLDHKGTPLYPIITWFDQRSTAQAGWWRERFDAEETARLTGLRVRPLYGVMKLLWLKQNRPDLFVQTATWLNLADWGAFKLSGEMGTDFSLASRTMGLDLAGKRWASDMLSAAGIDVGILADLVESGQTIGRIRPEAARETELPAGIPVCSGGHDHVCAALALGISAPGQLFDSMGTAESIMVISERPILDGSITARGIGQGMHVVPGRYYGMSGVHMSGGAIEWLSRLLLDEEYANQDRVIGYQKIEALAETVPAGSEGVLFLPHLRRANAPTLDPKGRGAFLGLTAENGMGHLARATLEGIAYEGHHVSQNLLDAFGISPTSPVITGGGSRNRLLMQIKADLLGLPLNLPQVEEATCLGAAMLAGIGAGIYRDAADAGSKIASHSLVETIQPEQASHQDYATRYQTLYRPLYASLKEINHLIDEHAGSV